MNAAESSEARESSWLDVLLLGIPFLAVWWWFADLEGFPANDDPFYGRPVQILVEDGRLQSIRQHGELSASSVAHILAGALVCGVAGFSYRNLFLAVILQLWLGAAAVYGCSSLAGSRRTWSLLLAGTFCLTPLVFGHAFTFMTDGPAAAWLAVAAYCFLQGFRKSSLPWLVAGSTAAAIAFWMRQTHVLVLLLPLTVLARAWSARNSEPLLWRKFAAILSVAALGMLLFESGWLVHSDLQRLDDALPRVDGLRRLHQIAVILYGQALVLAFTLLPLAPVIMARIRKERRTLSRGLRRGCDAAAAIVGALLLSAFAATAGRACLTSATGVFIQNAHFGPIFLSDMNEPGRWGDMGGVAWPLWVWQLLTVVSIANAAQLTWWAARTIGVWLHVDDTGIDTRLMRDAAAGLFVVWAAITAATVGLIEGVLDRYWLPLVPILLIWLGLSGGPVSAVGLSPLRVGGSVCLLLAMWAVAVVFVHDSLAWNQTRWRQAEAWLESGMQPADFDGGRDVNAWYRSAEDPDTRQRPGDTSAWWSGSAKVSLSIGPRPGWEVIHKLPWHAWATGEEHAILVLRKAN